jgi:trk system potassium uptake protein
MRILIVGVGKIGYTVAYWLAQEGHMVTVIDKDMDILTRVVNELDVVGFCGSGIDSSVLQEAEISEMDLFAALTGSDEQNLISCLIAKNLGVKNTIARIRQPVYSKAISIISGDLGLSMSVNPEYEAAMEIARILEFPFAKKVETFVHGRVEMIDYDVETSSPLCGKCIKDVFSKMHTALVCAVERSGEVFIPLGDFKFEAGDIITIIAPTGKLGDFFKQSGMRHHTIRKIVMCGGGRIGAYLARYLISRHISVTILEHSESAAHEIAAAIPAAEVVVGDGTSQYTLEETGISGADAFCCLTGIDEENILTSLHVKKEFPKIKTVTKINRAELIPIVQPLGVGSIVSPKQIAADRIVSFVRAKQNSVGSGVLTLHRLINGKAEALEFDVGADSRLKDIPIKDLKLKESVLLACINRGGEIISPHGGDMLRVGDTVIVVTTHSGFNVLDDILEGIGK